MRFIFGLLSRIPLAVLYAVISRPFFDWGYYILRWRRRLAADNLARSFPELSAEERATILKQSYRNLCDLMAGGVWYERRIADRRKVDEPHAIRILVQHVGADLQREARLAEAAHGCAE